MELSYPEWPDGDWLRGKLTPMVPTIHLNKRSTFWNLPFKMMIWWKSMVRVRRWIVLLGWHMFNGYVSFKQCFSVSLSYFLHIPHTCMFEQHCYPIGTQKLRYFWTTQTDPELWSRIDWCSIVHSKLRFESCSLLNFHQLTDIETNKIVSFTLLGVGENHCFPNIPTGFSLESQLVAHVKPRLLKKVQTTTGSVVAGGCWGKDVH